MLGIFGTFGTFKLLLSLSGTLRISLIFAILALLTKVGIFTFSASLSDIYLCVIHVAWRHTHNSGQDPSYSGMYLWVTRILYATHLCYAHTLSSPELARIPQIYSWASKKTIRRTSDKRFFYSFRFWAARILRYSVANSIQRPPSDSVGSSRHDQRTW